MKKIRKETMEKLTAMARCLSEGGTVRACLKEIGMSSDTYSRYKSLIWDMVKTMKKSEGKEEETEKSILEEIQKEVPPAPLLGDEDLGEAVHTLRKTLAFFDEVERLKRQMAAKLALPPPPYGSPSAESVEEKEKEERLPRTVGSPFELLKNAQELLNQAKSFLESFGYLVVPPHERHKWYHESEVKELIKKKLQEQGKGTNTIAGEQLKAVENIVNRIIDRIGDIFEKAMSGSTDDEKKKIVKDLIEEIEREEVSK